MMRWNPWLSLWPSAAMHDTDGERRAILVRAQRAEIIGDPLRQHRHDAVGEIDRIAALQRLAVERGAGPHIGGDIGDGDAQNKSAGIGRIGVGLGMDRVVMVLGVGGIDGHEAECRANPRDCAMPAGRARSASARTSGAKHMRNTMRMNGDQADRFFAVDGAEPFAHSRRQKAETARAQDVDGDEIAILRRAFVAGANLEFAAIDVFLVDRHDPAAAAQCGAKDAEHLGLRARQKLDDAPAIGGLAGFGVPAQASTRSKARSPRPGAGVPGLSWLCAAYS